MPHPYDPDDGHADFSTFGTGAITTLPVDDNAKPKTKHPVGFDSDTPAHRQAARVPRPRDPRTAKTAPRR